MGIRNKITRLRSVRSSLPGLPSLKGIKRGYIQDTNVYPNIDISSQKLTHLGITGEGFKSFVGSFKSAAGKLYEAANKLAERMANHVSFQNMH